MSTAERSGEGRTQSGDDRPLNDQEYQLVQRLFSDPFAFPLAFKSWLVSYLETSDMTLPMSSILKLTSTLGISGAGQGTLGIFPAGVILPYGGDTAPAGAALCNGGAYSSTLEKRLFDAIGYRYGGGGGTFNVPDLQGRIPVGVGPHADVAALGANEGLGTGQRRPRHRHTVSSIGWNSGGTTAGPNNLVQGDVASNELAVHAHDVGPTDVPATDAPAYLVISFIIIK